MPHTAKNILEKLRKAETKIDSRVISMDTYIYALIVIHLLQLKGNQKRQQNHRFFQLKQVSKEFNYLALTRAGAS